jgi:hypothetical protein
VHSVFGHVTSIGTEVADSFVQGKCFHLSPTQAVTARAGAQWDKVYLPLKLLTEQLLAVAKGHIA